VAQQSHVCFALLCLAFANAGMPNFFGVFFVHVAFSCVFMSLKRAGTHAREFPMKGSVVSGKLIFCFSSM
jgi:hypothetical protein